MFFLKLNKDRYVNCDFCESNDYELLYDKGRYNMSINNVICKKCGLVYINPRKSEKEIEKYYKSKYREIYSNTNKVTPKSLEDCEQRAIQHIDYLREYLFDEIKILDIGCSAGNFLKLVKENYKHCDLNGIEANTNFSKYGRDVYNLNIFNGMLGKYKTKKKFDLIYMSHILEHFESPSNALLKVNSLLNENGYLFIEVPTILYPYISLDFFFQDAHLFTFSPITLQNYLIKQDFSIIKMEQVGWFLRCIAKKNINKIENKIISYDDYNDILNKIRNFKWEE